jgi:hypothetical protein
MPDAAYGFGYPFFSYYASLPYYLAASFDLMGLDILTAIKLTQTLFMAVAALSMYRWAEGFLQSPSGAWLAAVAYTAAPFHLVNLYTRGDSLSEFAAFAFFPLILRGLDQLAGRPSAQRILPPALAYGGLILTHNVSALIFSPFVLLYVAFHAGRAATLDQDRSPRTLAARLGLLALPLLVALLVSAWFWLPALAETGYVQLEAQTTGYFFYGNHFRGSTLLQRKLLFDYATGAEGSSPFAMGLVQFILALAGALIVIVSQARTSLSRWSIESESVHGRDLAWHPGTAFALVGLLLSTWLITPFSRPVWDHLPLLPMVQFPWRFLSIQALFTALLTGAAISRVGAERRYAAWSAAIALGALLVIAAVAGLQPVYLPINADDVTAERLQLYELFTGNIGSTIRYEYLPAWAKPRPYIGPEQFMPESAPRAIHVRGDPLRAERLDREPTRQVWRVNAGSEGARVAFPIYYWPGWQARVDGLRVEVEPAEGSGYLSLSIPQGAHRVEIRLGRTPLRLGAEIISLVTSVAMLVVTVIAWRLDREGEHEKSRKTERHRPSSLNHNQYAVISCLPFIALLSLLVAFQPRVSATGSDDLTMDFEQMPYLHHNPEGVILDGWRLTGYEYGGVDASINDAIMPGQALEVTLDWEKTEDSGTSSSPREPVTLQMVSPAAVRQDELPPVAEAAIGSDERQPPPGTVHRSLITLRIPVRTAPGIHLLRLGQAPFVYLRPIRIHDGQRPAGEPARATFADGALQLRGLQAVQTTPERLHVQLDWSSVRPVAANYGLSLSLTDPAGNEWLHQGSRPGYNTQPGHGFLPTSLWPINRVMEDYHLPAVRPGAPPANTYLLTISLYQVSTWEPVGQHTVPIALTKPSKRSNVPVATRFGEELILSKLEMPSSVRQGERWAATTYWSTVEEPSQDYVVEWRLEGTEETIASVEPMAPGSAPTGWPVDAWVAGRTALSIPPTMTPGHYTVSLTLRESTVGTPVGTYTHPVPLEIREQNRVWEVPEMDHTVGVRFGDMIELAGYDLTEGKGKLQLTLYWQALRTPDRHYMFFVHLADPQTGEPASQVDAMPRGFTYPTGQWAPGEVVSDVVEISTEGIASGHYVLAVGWYDPDTKVRLPAVDADGRRLSGDRLVLPSSITVP